MKCSRSAWCWIAAVLLLCAGAYAVLSYGLPYLTWRQAMRLKATMDGLAREASACPQDDKACQEKGRQLWQELRRDLAVLSQLYAPMNEAVQSPEVIDALKHPDGTVCYMVHAPMRKVTDDELRAWLAGYGAQRFYDQFASFLASIEPYERLYHGASPRDVWLATFSRLKWHHAPFGRTWRMYNLTARLAKWVGPASQKGEVPDELLKEIESQFKEHGEYFTGENSLRLYDLAKEELKGDAPQE